MIDCNPNKTSTDGTVSSTSFSLNLVCLALIPFFFIATAKSLLDIARLFNFDFSSNSCWSWNRQQKVSIFYLQALRFQYSNLVAPTDEQTTPNIKNSKLKRTVSSSGLGCSVVTAFTVSKPPAASVSSSDSLAESRWTFDWTRLSDTIFDWPSPSELSSDWLASESDSSLLPASSLFWDFNLAAAKGESWILITNVLYSFLLHNTSSYCIMFTFIT